MTGLIPPVLILGLAAVLAFAAPERADAQGSDAPVAAAVPGDALPVEFGGPFSLIDHQGRPRSREDFLGEFRIIYFGYTECPDTCSTAMVNLAAVLDELADDGHLLGGLFITIDPQYDTPERLAEYLAPIHPRFLGLTGDAEEIDRLQKTFQVHAGEVADKGGFERLYEHQPLGFLMGPKGRILTLFPPLLPTAVIARIIHGYL